MSDLQRWWASLPLVTKWLFVGSMGLTLAAHFGLVSPYLLILDWDKVIRHFQLWRLVTCFLFHGRLGFPFLIHMLFLVRYGAALETSIFGGRLSDFLYMITVSCLLLLLGGYLLDAMILGMGLIMVLIYYWSRKNPDVQMSFMFGLRFKG
ncbi:Derlin 1 [Balamuthia mandrillaris]